MSVFDREMLGSLSTISVFVMVKMLFDLVSVSDLLLVVRSCWGLCILNGKLLCKVTFLDESIRKLNSKSLFGFCSIVRMYLVGFDSIVLM